MDNQVNTSAAKPRYYNIDGAPYKIDKQVKILDNPLDDETFDSQYSNMEGKVIYYEYDCGCGQSFPDDPMIGVQFPDGRTEEFWKDELTCDF